MKRKGGDVRYFRYRRNGNEVAVKIGPSSQMKWWRHRGVFWRVVK